MNSQLQEQESTCCKV